MQFRRQETVRASLLLDTLTSGPWPPRPRQPFPSSARCRSFLKTHVLLTVPCRNLSLSRSPKPSSTCPVTSTTTNHVRHVLRRHTSHPSHGLLATAGCASQLAPIRRPLPLQHGRLSFDHTRYVSFSLCLTCVVWADAGAKLSTDPDR